MADESNDNDNTLPVSSAQDSDAHGRAAMLLVESLIHGLIARSVISAKDAAEIVEVAQDIDTEIAAEQEGPPSTTRKSQTLLAAIRASLDFDLVDDTPNTSPKL